MIDNETLVKRIQQGENVNDNMMQLYNQNTGLLYRALKRYNGYGNIIDKDDLMQEAYIYLYEAVNRYKVDKGVKFTTYLTNSIKWNIGRDMRNKRAIKLPIYIYIDISKYMRFLEEYTKEHDKQPTDKEVIERLGISESRLKTVKDAVNMVSISSMDKLINDDMTIGDTIKDCNNDLQEIEHKYDCKKLKSDLWKELENILTDTQIQVLKFRYIEKLTLQECSERLGISYQAVHAKTTNTVSKLKGNYKIRGLANKYL